MHLTDEQLYYIAEITEEMQPYNDKEMKQMEHLKACKECYDKFCISLALAEMTSESGYMVLADIYNISRNIVAETSLNEKILAVVNVVRKKAEASAAAVIEQINQIGSLLKLEQPIALGARGSSNTESTSLKLEDIEDEKTFVVFDSQNNKLMVQINVKNMVQKDIQVYLTFDAGETIDVPLTKKGNIVKGILEDIPDMDFKIHIENK